VLSTAELRSNASRDFPAFENVHRRRPLDDHLQFGLQGAAVSRSSLFQPLDRPIIEISDQYSCHAGLHSPPQR
jgi:hypothetical protein